MKVYIIECYNSSCESTCIKRVCKRREVAEYFVKRFSNIDNSRLPLYLQAFDYTYSIREYTLIE